MTPRCGDAAEPPPPRMPLAPPSTYPFQLPTNVLNTYIYNDPKCTKPPAILAGARASLATGAHLTGSRCCHCGVSRAGRFIWTYPAGRGGGAPPTATSTHLTGSISKQRMAEQKNHTPDHPKGAHVTDTPPLAGTTPQIAIFSLPTL